MKGPWQWHDWEAEARWIATLQASGAVAGMRAAG